jgi:protein-tyrosine-phosphatase
MTTKFDGIRDEETVLILCTGNSAQMAEGLLGHDARDGGIYL